MTPDVDSSLASWTTLATTKWPTLLIGNGLSINLWEAFGYESLYSQAHMSEEAKGVFEEVATTNFEEVLEAVHHARIVCSAIKSPTLGVEQLYDEIRGALFSTVSSAHIDWSFFPSDTHDIITTELDTHSSVYTTNYDLCLYWSHMETLTRASPNIVDFFWNSRGVFNPEDTNIRSSKATAMYYLHGALHLWQDDAGHNGKWMSAEAGNLRKIHNIYPSSSGRRPLFVSEGNSRSKQRTIARSPYLTFCLDSLIDNQANMVIFGQALSDQDKHIVDAINKGPARKVAVSIYPSTDAHVVIEQKIRFNRALRGHEVHFFDSTTHPLGQRHLQIRQP